MKNITLGYQEKIKGRHALSFDKKKREEELQLTEKEIEINYGQSFFNLQNNIGNHNI